MKIYRILANVVFVFHWIWVAILLVGALMELPFPWYIPIHYTVLLITFGAQRIWQGCPLTKLENALRAKCEPNKIYGGSFITHYTGIRIMETFK